MEGWGRLGCEGEREKAALKFSVFFPSFFPFFLLVRKKKKAWAESLSRTLWWIWKLCWAVLTSTGNHLLPVNASPARLSRLHGNWGRKRRRRVRVEIRKRLWVRREGPRSVAEGGGTREFGLWAERGQCLPLLAGRVTYNNIAGTIQYNRACGVCFKLK